MQLAADTVTAQPLNVLEVLFVNSPSHVFAIENRAIKIGNGRIELLHGVHQIFQILENYKVCSDGSRDGIHITAVSDQFIARGHIDAIDVWISVGCSVPPFDDKHKTIPNRGSTAGYNNPLCADILSHLNDFLGGCPTDN